MSDRSDTAPASRARPPFEVVPGQPAADAAAEIVAVFASVAARPDKLAWVERETSRRFEAESAPAFQAAAGASRAIARAIDADVPAADRNPYHDRQHLCEVTLAACFLGRLHRLPARDAQRLLLAALIHDLDHDGLPGGDFSAERRSVEQAMPLLRAAGVDEAECRRLAALVLATEPTIGTGHALAAAAGQGGKAPAGAPGLALLNADVPLARLALLLCEADLLPSAGLTWDHGHRMQQRLAAEWQRPLGAADKLRFLDHVLADGLVGDFFRPNTLAFRARLADPAPDGTARR